MDLIERHRKTRVEIERINFGTRKVQAKYPGIGLYYHTYGENLTFSVYRDPSAGTISYTNMEVTLLLGKDLLDLDKDLLIKQLLEEID